MRMVRKCAAVLVAALALGALAFAEPQIMPGLSFIGSSEPALSFEVLGEQVTVGATIAMDRVVVCLKNWPWGYTGGEDAIPTYFGLGVTTKGEDGQYVAGLFAEAGLRLISFLEVGFGIHQFGAVSEITLNLTILFDLKELGFGTDGG